MLAWSKLLVFTGKKLAFQVLNIGPSPLRPPHVNSYDEWDQAFPVFRCVFAEDTAKKGEGPEEVW